MKKLLTLLLILVLLLPIFGCDGTVPPETAPSTQPTDAQAAVPTTTPTEPEETTVPPETTEATEPATNGNLSTYVPDPGLKLSQEVLDEYQFAVWEPNGNFTTYLYHYNGENPVVTMPSGDVVIALPEQWRDHVTVVWSGRDDENGWGTWSVYVFCTDLTRAWAAHEEGVSPEEVTDNMFRAHMYDSYILKLYLIRKTDVATIRAMEPEMYLGEDEDFVYSFIVPDFWEDWWDMWHYREDMMDALGEDTYNTLLNGMVITEEMAREMITITGLIEE